MQKFESVYALTIIYANGSYFIFCGDLHKRDRTMKVSLWSARNEKCINPTKKKLRQIKRNIDHLFSWWRDTVLLL